MRKTLAAGALLLMTAGAALAQGPANGTVNPSPAAPGTTLPGATGPTPTPRPQNSPVVQSPSASVNTTAQTTNSPSPSAVQTHDTTSRTAAAPVPGRNSFTIGQARQRIASAGFSNVKDLKKDDQGIWRGQATKGAVAVSVALDYQGNVVGK